MRRRRGRRLVAALAALAVSGLLAACGGLPASSPVTDGRRLDEPIDDTIRIAPQAPVAGATPEQIARGFIRAAEDNDETHATAKTYLAHGSVARWQWSTENALIYNRPSDLRVERTSDDAVTVTVAPVGLLATNGRYHDVAPGTVVTATFGLTKVAGEWRLELPQEGFGMWLEAGAFDRLYVSAPVYYVSPSGRQLVPDPRWFLKSTRLTTSVARAQLEPVPAYLAGAVVTGVPKSTRLAVNSVPVEAGHADINLTGAALEAGPEERRAMWAQMSAALAWASVSSISISVEGTDLELPGIGRSLSNPRDVGYDLPPVPVEDSALLRKGARFERINPMFIPDDAIGRPPRAVPSHPDDPAQIPPAWVQLTLSADGLQVAAVGGDLKELSIWPANEEHVALAHFANSLTRPAYDRSRFLWVGGVDADEAARLWVVNTASLVPVPEPKVLSVPWLKGRRVKALTVSADGTRILVVSEDAATRRDDRLVVAGVVRAANGEPTGLSEPLQTAQALTTIKDVVWLDAESYAVLGRMTDRDAVGPWIGHIGGGLDGVRVTFGQPDPSRDRLGTVPSALSITTVGGARGIICITDRQKIMARVGLGWTEINSGTDLLVPGR